MLQNRCQEVRAVKGVAQETQMRADVLSFVPDAVGVAPI